MPGAQLQVNREVKATAQIEKSVRSADGSRRIVVDAAGGASDALAVAESETSIASAAGGRRAGRAPVGAVCGEKHGMSQRKRASCKFVLWQLDCEVPLPAFCVPAGQVVQEPVAPPVE